MMLNVFKNNYLKDYVILNLEIDKSTFLEKLHKHVDLKNNKAFIQDLDKSKKLFKGKMFSDYLIIKRKGIIIPF